MLTLDSKESISFKRNQISIASKSTKEFILDQVRIWYVSKRFLLFCKGTSVFRVIIIIPMNSKKKEIRFVSLFSGCGGLDLGLCNSGLIPVAAYDSWELAVENYNSNVSNHAKVHDLSDGTLPVAHTCDVLVAGSPCQGFSTIGKRDLNDPRNSLVNSAIQIGLNLNSKVIILENVPGVLQGAHKKYWEAATEKLGVKGYKVKTLLINSSDLGVAQMRKRAFLIAVKGASDFDISFHSKQTKNLIDVLEISGNEKNHEISAVKLNKTQLKISRMIGQGQKLCDVRGGSSSIHTWEIPEIYGDVTEQEKNTLESILKLRRRIRRRSYGDADPVSIQAIEEDLCIPVVSEVNSLLKKGYLKKKGVYIDLMNGFNGKFRRPKLGGLSYTVDTQFGEPRNFLHPTENRGFTVREAARIQAFPDDYVFKGSIRDQYKMIGNAVPPPLGEAIAEIIKNALMDVSDE